MSTVIFEGLKGNLQQLCVWTLGPRWILVLGLMLRPSYQCLRLTGLLLSALFELPFSSGIAAFNVA